MGSLNPPLAGIAANQGGAFTRAQALASGYSSAEVQRLVDRKHWHRLRRGGYVLRQVHELATEEQLHVLRLRAFLAASEADVVATGVTAALVHGFNVHGVDLSTCLVVHRDGQHPYSAGGVRHREAELTDDEVALVDGIPVTTPARTVIDCARHQTFASAVVTADSALRAGLSPADLRTAAARARSWSGGRTATRVAGFADRRAQSPGESLTRVLISEAGLPAPEPQFPVHDRLGLIGLVDLALVAWRVLVEFDGRSKYGIDEQDAREQLWAEKQREDRLREAGWEVVRVIWPQLSNPHLRLRILEARERAAGRGVTRSS